MTATDPTHQRRPRRKEEPGNRRPRLKPSLNHPRLKKYDLTSIQMGLEALIALERFRLLTNRQLARYLFLDHPNKDGVVRSDDAAYTACNRYCLRRLFDLGLIRRLPVIRTSVRAAGTYQDAVNVLTKAGHDIVMDYRASGGQAVVRWTRSLYDMSNVRLSHYLDVAEFIIHLQRACWREGLQLRDWWDEFELAEMKDLHFASIPDAFAVIVNERQETFPMFAEIDRGNATVLGYSPYRKDWRLKITNYGEYLAPGGEYETNPFYEGLHDPILVALTDTDLRLTTMLKTTYAAGGKGRYWLTTMDDYFGDYDPGRVWQPIWRVPHKPERRSLLERIATLAPIKTAI